MESTAKTPRFPTWAKVLLGIALLLAIAGIILIAALVLFFNDFQKHNTDPAVVKDIANSIAIIEDPLPPGYKYAVGLDFSLLKMAAVLHYPDNLELILTSLPSTKSDTTLEDNISASMLNPALSNATGATSKFEASFKSSEQVANKKFIYAIGSVKDKEGRSIPALFGFFAPTENGRVVMLVGLQGRAPRPIVDSRIPSHASDTHPPPDTGSSAGPEEPDSTDAVKAFNMAATENFLHAIKKF
jgi:hypothetical protein